MTFWNWRIFDTVNKPVFFISAFTILLTLLFAVIDPQEASKWFRALQAGIVSRFGWFYVLSVAFFLIFVIFLAASSYGNVKLAPDHDTPDFSYLSWMAMLFAAGMGIGLMFFGVAEPVSHYISPPVMAGGSIEAAREAMKITFFHWGVHAWAVYAVIGLSLAYFCYRRGLPLTIRSSLYPFLGDKIYGPIGHIVDILAVVSTMFGIATSLGVGVMQINAGFNHLFGLPETQLVQFVLITLITAVATMSVVAGLKAGIKRLSEFNLVLAFILLLFVLITGPTLFLLQAFVQNIGGYLSDIVTRTFTLFAYKPNSWIGDWTLFYWAWWISWSPFVGMFIARISKGRTIREFIVGVLLIPSGFTFLWMTVFGNSAILFDMMGETAIAHEVVTNMPVALFRFFEMLPMSGFVSLLGTILAMTFFVTSSDSGSLVIDSITSRGAQKPSRLWQRIFWAAVQGFIAAILLTAGGLQALQAASLASALPFTVVMIMTCFGLLRALQDERARNLSHRVAATLAVNDVTIPWKQRLRSILTFPKKAEAERFLSEIAHPALAEVAQELEKRGLKTRLDREDDKLRLLITEDAEGAYPFDYAIHLRNYVVPGFAFDNLDPESAKTPRFYRAEVFQSEGGEPYDVFTYSREQLMADVIAQYDRYHYYIYMIS